MIVLSGPTFTEITPVAVAPPLDEYGTVKVAFVACSEELRELTGVTVNEQLLAVRVTDASLVLSMLVASPQVIVYPLPLVSLA